MEYRDEFLDHLRVQGFRPRTLVKFEFNLDRFFSYLFEQGITKISEVTRQHVESYRLHVFSLTSKATGQKRSIGFIYARLNVVKKYFRYLTGRGHLFIDPTRNLTYPKTVRALPRGILSQEEIELLLTKPNLKTASGLRDRAILELFYCSGLRLQEMVNLNLYDLDLPQGIIRINKGKNQKDRVIPIGRIAADFIGQYLAKIRPRWARSSLESALFLTAYRSRINPQTVNVNVRKYARRLFPGRRISCHSLRHTCATHLLRGGANIRYIQQLLGYSCITTTQIYTRVSPIDLKAAHQKYHPRGKLSKKP